MSFRPLYAMNTGRAMFLLDLAIMAGAWPVMLNLTMPGLDNRARLVAMIASLLFPVANLAYLYALGLYRRDVIAETRRAIGRIPLVAALGAITVVAVTLMFGRIGPGATPTRLFVAATGTVFACDIGARVIFHALRRQGLFRRRLLVIGAGRRAWDLVWMLKREGRALNYEVAFIHHPAFGEIDPRLADESAGPILAAPRGILAEARRFDADQVVVAPDERRGMDLHCLLECKVAGFPVKQYLSFVEKEIRRVDLKRMELSWLLYSDGFYFGLIDRVLKRALDITMSALLLLLTAPLLIGAAILIKLDDGGPILYRQERITLNRRSFRVAKLRTMRVDAEAGGAVWAAARDGRITRIGGFLRRTRLDELPQLFNVLSGSMSLVGPRPERPNFVAMLSEAIPLYHERHTVKAGLTGWAQINYPYGASTDDARSKLSYDLYYVKNFSIIFDMLIILQTIRVVLWPGGVR